MTKPSGLAGKIAFVTGAGGGIGAAVVRALHEEGARVVASDLTAPHFDHADIMGAALDVTDSAAVDALVDRVERDWGAIDLVANVAGILSGSQIIDSSDAEWRHVFDVNTHGVFHVCRAIGQRMKPRRRGSIVTVSSNAAGVPRHAMGAYAASKAATTMLTRVLGLELAEFGIRCNIVAPGSTLTPMQTGMWADDSGAARVIAGVPEAFKAGIPLGKLATPEDIADAVTFLLSDRAAHITMTDLYVDGGATLRA